MTKNGLLAATGAGQGVCDSTVFPHGNTYVNKSMSDEVLVTLDIRPFESLSCSQVRCCFSLLRAKPG